MRTTIKDVAKAAGVSPSTVSFIINNKPVPISKETKERVWAAIRDLNYRPNQIAVGLVTNTTNTIGLILPDSTNPFFATLSHHIEKKLRKNNMSIIVGNTDGDPNITREYLHLFYDRRVDGIILAQLDFENESETISCQSLMQEIGIPVVYVDRISSGYKHHSTVEVDQVEIGYLATKHLLELGHRRIGCAAGNIHLLVNNQRYEGYTNALKEYGLVPDPELLFCDSLSIESGTRALPYLLDKKVSAVFAFNDMIAYGIYHACQDYGVSIPQDLSIVGVDDIPFSKIISPPLTTISQPITEIADAAVSKLLNLIYQPDQSHSHIMLHSKLECRASACAPTEHI